MIWFCSIFDFKCYHFTKTSHPSCFMKQLINFDGQFQSFCHNSSLEKEKVEQWGSHLFSSPLSSFFSPISQPNVAAHSGPAVDATFLGVIVTPMTLAIATDSSTIIVCRQGLPPRFAARQGGVKIRNTAKTEEEERKDLWLEPSWKLNMPVEFTTI